MRISGTARNRDLFPDSRLPLAYFAFAHLCLALALAILVVHPDLPGGSFYQPRMLAVIHLVTLGWISASILGAFYIVAPLALGMPLRASWIDRGALGAFALGTAGIAAAFWTGRYSAIGWAGPLVAAAVLSIAVRAWMGLPKVKAPWPVKLHVALAFANMLAASLVGTFLGLNRVHGWVAWSPVSAAFAHAHLAAVGWAVMMVIGLSYRLLPMIIPAEMPRGSALASSAILLEAGTSALACSLITGRGQTMWGAVLIVLAIASFVTQMRRMAIRTLPKPAALPRPDWATWQALMAFVWLLIAVVAGLLLPRAGPDRIVRLEWIYGGAGLVGFLAQVVVGVQGRLLPLYSWYRLMEHGGMRPPTRSAHTLANHGLAKAIFLAWTLGVPPLLWGLTANVAPWIAAGGALLLAGVVCNAVQMALVVRARPR